MQCSLLIICSKTPLIQGRYTVNENIPIWGVLLVMFPMNSDSLNIYPHASQSVRVWGMCPHQAPYGLNGARSLMMSPSMLVVHCYTCSVKTEMAIPATFVLQRGSIHSIEFLLQSM